jgi:hypothetical protein
MELENKIAFLIHLYMHECKKYNEGIQNEMNEVKIELIDTLQQIIDTNYEKFQKIRNKVEWYLIFQSMIPSKQKYN